MLTVLMLGLLVCVPAPGDADNDCLLNPAAALELEPPEIVARFGQQVELNCSTKCLNHKGIYWRIGNETTRLEEFQSFANLTHTISWDVPPQCILKVNGSYEHRKPLPMTVYQTPDTVSISVENHSGPLREGRAYTLRCDVLNVAPAASLTVSWLWGEDMRHTDTYDHHITKTPENVSSTFEITAFRNNSNVMITCLTILFYPKQNGPAEKFTTSTAFPVIVHYAPEFLLPPVTREVTEGVNVTLECRASGNPAPEISWPDVTPNNDTLSTTENQTTLLIMGVSQSNNYTCTASNIVGRITQTFTVNVFTTLPDVQNRIVSCPLEFIPKRVVARYGDSFSVTCRFTSTSMAPEHIGWETSVGRQRTINQSVIWTVKKLEDWTLRPQCFATFADDQCTEFLPISLYKTPDTVSISVENHSGPLWEGRAYTLRCDVLNVAPAANLTVSWLWGDDMRHTDTYDHRLTKTPENVSSTFQITAFRGDHSKITCLTTLYPKEAGPAKNLNTSTTFTVIIYYAPEISEKNNSVEVVRGGNVSLECSAKGNPPPEVKWNYPAAVNANETTWGRQRNVSITGATSANGGIYICVATNKVGTVTRSTTLTITTPDHTTVVVVAVVMFGAITIIIFLLYSYCRKNHGQYNVLPLIGNVDTPPAQESVF